MTTSNRLMHRAIGHTPIPPRGMDGAAVAVTSEAPRMDERAAQEGLANALAATSSDMRALIKRLRNSIPTYSEEFLTGNGGDITLSPQSYSTNLILLKALIVALPVPVPVPVSPTINASASTLIPANANGIYTGPITISATGAAAAVVNIKGLSSGTNYATVTLTATNPQAGVGPINNLQEGLVVSTASATNIVCSCGYQINPVGTLQLGTRKLTFVGGPNGGLFSMFDIAIVLRPEDKRSLVLGAALPAPNLGWVMLMGQQLPEVDL